MRLTVTLDQSQEKKSQKNVSGGCGTSDVEKKARSVTL
jgi:hypothetical protein